MNEKSELKTEKRNRLKSGSRLRKYIEEKGGVLEALRD